jgi:hypothetical protein
MKLIIPEFFKIPLHKIFKRYYTITLCLIILKTSLLSLIIGEGTLP